ncbi:acetyl-CoA carboxylase biotin carboxyl carrier protein [Streptomyces sp. RKAG337]|uniref:acetyl-CoA carboxylase biotin carboxyl carrier protein n=1 Tax=Streptomyces sp. RKAG337 TaxID=2893404 RepID=UPI002034337F|nr:biotin/lipoyl-containing protein [Streptomyces sp. RKAG337]MCM2429975.1 acetyl-CoA carboxylase biotin carboxyl carrier protein subunit [Streptomyces sp. RKAG337]
MKPDHEQRNSSESNPPADDHVPGAPPVPPAPDSALPAGAVLDAVCRSVVRLSATTAHPPSRIRMQDGQITVEVEWPDPAALSRPAPAAGAQVAAPESGAAPAGDGEALDYVRAPMVGTFYHASSPDAPPYVGVGDVVTPGQPVGVLEAMKLMSTITAEVGGRVTEVLAPNGQPVEFDQQLIALEPVGAEAEAGADMGAGRAPAAVAGPSR